MIPFNGIQIVYPRSPLFRASQSSVVISFDNLLYSVICYNWCFRLIHSSASTKRHWLRVMFRRSIMFRPLHYRLKDVNMTTQMRTTIFASEPPNLSFLFVIVCHIWIKRSLRIIPLQETSAFHACIRILLFIVLD